MLRNEVEPRSRNGQAMLLAFSGATEGIGVCHLPEDGAVEDGGDPLVDSGGLGLAGAGDMENPDSEDFDEVLQAQGWLIVVGGWPCEMQAGAAQFPGEKRFVRLRVTRK